MQSMSPRSFSDLSIVINAILITSVLFGKIAFAEETKENNIEMSKSSANTSEGESDDSAKYLAQDVKIVGLRINSGTIYLGGTASFLHLYWRYFYLETLRLSLAMMPDLMALIGTVVGFPLKIDSGGKHRIHFGLGIAYGGMTNNTYGKLSCDEGYECWGDSTGLILIPQISYVRQIAKWFAFQGGIEADIAMSNFKNDGKNAEYPYPHFLGFVGFTI